MRIPPAAEPRSRLLPEQCFENGPEPTGQPFCIDTAALDFKPGYGS